MNNFNQLTVLELDLLGSIAYYLEEMGEGMYYCDLIAENEFNLEIIYTNEARDFVVNNIEEVFETLGEMNLIYGDLDLLFEGGLNLYKVANHVKYFLAKELFRKVVDAFEGETGYEIINERYFKNEEAESIHNELKQFINDILKKYE